MLKWKMQEFHQWLNADSQNWDEIKTKLVKTAFVVVPLKRHKKYGWWDEQCEKTLYVLLRNGAPLKEVKTLNNNSVKYKK